MSPARNTYRFTALAVVLTLVLVGGLWWIFSGSGQRSVTAYFGRAVGVYPGSDVRVLGVPVGLVDSVTPRGDRVEVTMTLDAGVVVAADTGALIVAPSVVADRYVQLSKPAGAGPVLADGAVIGTDRTATPVELDQLYNSLNTLTTALGPKGANRDGALSDLIDTGAANLAGNGRELNNTIRQFAGLADTLAGSKDDLFGTVSELRRFVSVLATDDSQVRKVTAQLATVTSSLADDRDELAGALDQLGTALADVQQFVRDNRGLLKDNVDKLADTTKTLVGQRASLAEALDVAPLAVSNVLGAIDPATGRLSGRADLLDYLASPLPLPSAQPVGAGR